MYGAFFNENKESQTIPLILEKYFLAWETHNIQLLRSIFCKNATYKINSNRVLRGITAIEHYWKKNAIEQADVRWSVKNYIHSEFEITADWEAHFYRRDKVLFYHVSGKMKLRLLGGKILSLSEEYNKNTNR
jgi:hypothetical protein